MQAKAKHKSFVWVNVEVGLKFDLNKLGSLSIETQK